MFAFELIAERRIKEAMDRGEFDNLHGMGKPLPKDNMDYIPQELRMVYTILKNSDVLPEEITVKKEIHNLTKLLETALTDEEEKIVRRKISHAQLKYKILCETRGLPLEEISYHLKILEKLKVKE